jgi:hypothetical protein
VSKESHVPASTGSLRVLRTHLPAFISNPQISVVVLSLAWIAAYIVDSALPPPALEVEVRSDADGVAQVFYDTGVGMSEAESATAPVNASDTYETLHFPLPDRDVRGLRFDPLNGPGTLSVRRVSVVNGLGSVVKEFALGDLGRGNQIAVWDARGSELQFSTTPGANDPIVQIAVAEPFDPSPWTLPRLARVLVGLLLSLVLVSIAGAVSIAAWPYLPKAGQALDRLAAALSDKEFLIFDRLAIAFYLSITTAFVLAVSAGLHGSSMSLHSAVPLDESTRPLLGTPKPIRSDEWAYHSPAILHQVHRATPFAVERSALGPDNAALLANVPVWHFTTLFRPQFWGFFVLPASYGFSFYWQFKALLLLGGVFTLLLVLTGSSKLALLGALWYATSAFVQWTYSWPSLLPEMVGLFGLVMCTTMYMSVGSRAVLLLVAAVVCVVGAVNFALCAYVPHQIPLVWFGVFLVSWWASSHWDAVSRRDGLTHRLLALGGAWIVIAIVLLLFYRDAQAAIATIANTVYPGQRSLPGGTYAVSMLFSHFFGFWANDIRFPLPQFFSNISECAGFLWLAPVTLFLARATRGDSATIRAYWTIVLFGAFLVAWLTLPLPQAVGQATLLDKSGSGRSIHVLGLANVALVMICLRLSRVESGVRLRESAFLGGAVFAIVFPVFLLLNATLAGFLTIPQVAVAAAYVAVLIVAMVANQYWLLAFCLVLPQLLAFGLVNPIDRGLRVIESSRLFQFMQSREELRRDRWIVYSPSVTHPGLFNAVGAEVVNGLDYVPDLKSLSVFDPGGAQEETINRSVWLLAEPRYDDGGPPYFEYPQFNTLILRVNPLDARLQRIGVRYAAFLRKPPEDVAARMKALSPGPVSGFWLYELPDPGVGVQD